MLESKLYLLKQIASQSKKKENKDIIRSFKHLVNDIFILNPNPIKISVQILEVLEIIKDKNYYLKLQAEQQEVKIMKKLSYLISQLHIKHLKDFLLDKDIDGKEVIDLMYKMRLQELFSHKGV